MIGDPNQTLPSGQYTLPQTDDYRRKMAFELMYGKGQTQQPEMKHWTQLLGNLGNSAVGNKMFNQANQLGRESDIDDITKFKKNLSGASYPPVPGVGGGQPPFQASGPVSGGPGGLPLAGGPLPMQQPVQGMGGPLSNPPPQMAGGPPPMPMQPRPPMQFPGAGGFPQEQWPQAPFNPQG